MVMLGHDGCETCAPEIARLQGRVTKLEADLRAQRRLSCRLAKCSGYIEYAGSVAGDVPWSRVPCPDCGGTNAAPPLRPRTGEER